MINPNTIAVLDLDLFKGISFGLSFQIQPIDQDGNPEGSYDLTGKVVAVIFSGIFKPELELLSSQAPNSSGSYVSVTNPLTGMWNFHLTASQLKLVSASDGYWRVEIREGQDAEMIVRGNIRVVPFGGESV